MVKGKALSFNQKMDAFLKLAKANPDKSYKISLKKSQRKEVIASGVNRCRKR
ncbi:hypothetical protein HCCKFEEG_00004 [Methanosarcina spherical virus]|nr:hypothetical protein HCCKFEEG_00004 [Methanosarcina spherical virus]